MDYQGAQQAHAAQAVTSYGGHVGTAAATPQQTIMGAAQQELDMMIDHAARNLSRMRDINARLFGPVPDKTAAGGPRPVANSAVQAMGEKVETLKSILRDQSDQIDQMNKIV